MVIIQLHRGKLIGADGIGTDLPVGIVLPCVDMAMDSAANHIGKVYTALTVFLGCPVISGCGIPGNEANIAGGTTGHFYGGAFVVALPCQVILAGGHSQSPNPKIPAGIIAVRSVIMELDQNGIVFTQWAVHGFTVRTDFYSIIQKKAYIANIKI